MRQESEITTRGPYEPEARARSPYGTGYRAIAILLILLAGLSAMLGAAPAKAQTSIVSAVLPTSRSVQVGATAIVFVTIINTGGVTATACSIAPPAGFSGSLSYQTTDSATNALSGTLNTPANIPAGGSQSFAVFIQPSQAFAATDLALVYICQNATAVSLTGINTLQLSSSATPVADIIALAATQDAGVVNAAGSALQGVFSVASSNLGASATVSVAVDFGSTSLPLTASICETNPTTGICLATPSSGVTTTIGTGATPTFAVFITSTGEIILNPSVNRIFVRFRDGGGVVRGSTSVAVASPAPVTVSRFAGAYTGTFSGTSFGVFNIVIDSNGVLSGSGQALDDGTVFGVQGSVSATGSFAFTAGSTTGGATFSGTISDSGSLSGSWQDPAFGESGSFSGNRSS